MNEYIYLCLVIPFPFAATHQPAQHSIQQTTHYYMMGTPSNREYFAATLQVALNIVMWGSGFGIYVCCFVWCSFWQCKQIHTHTHSNTPCKWFSAELVDDVYIVIQVCFSANSPGTKRVARIPDLIQKSQCTIAFT